MDLKKEFVMKSMNPNLVFRDLCKEYGISPKTGYKWKKRFMEEGLGGLKDLPIKPKRSPRKLQEDSICEIIRLKNAHPNWGPKKIRKIYANKNEGSKIPSLSTFNRMLEKAGLVL